jgi:hypothetical protein
VLLVTFDDSTSWVRVEAPADTSRWGAALATVVDFG